MSSYVFFNVDSYFKQIGLSPDKLQLALAATLPCSVLSSAPVIAIDYYKNVVPVCRATTDRIVSKVTYSFKKSLMAWCVWKGLSPLVDYFAALDVSCDIFAHYKWNSDGAIFHIHRPTPHKYTYHDLLLTQIAESFLNRGNMSAYVVADEHPFLHQIFILLQVCIPSEYFIPLVTTFQPRRWTHVPRFTNPVGIFILLCMCEVALTRKGILCPRIAYLERIRVTCGWTASIDPLIQAQFMTEMQAIADQGYDTRYTAAHALGLSAMVYTHVVCHRLPFAMLPVNSIVMATLRASNLINYTAIDKLVHDTTLHLPWAIHRHAHSTSYAHHELIRALFLVRHILATKKKRPLTLPLEMWVLAATFIPCSPLSVPAETPSQSTTQFVRALTARLSL